MHIGGVDDGDIKVRLARLEAGRHRDARGPCPHHDNRVMALAGLVTGHAARRDAPHETGHVISCRLGARQDLGHAVRGCGSQGPQRGRAGAGAAIGQHRSRQRVERGGEGGHVGPVDLAADNGDERRLEAQALCVCLNRRKAGLVGRFRVGPVADDRAKTRGLHGLHVFRSHLSRHGQARGQSFAQHGAYPLGGQRPFTGTFSTGLPSASRGSSPARMLTCSDGMMSLGMASCASRSVRNRMKSSRDFPRPT